MGRQGREALGGEEEVMGRHMREAGEDEWGMGGG